jgi:hypothetical protein
LIAKWQDLLRPGGKVVTVNRLRPSAPEDEARFTSEQARSFRDAALRKAQGLREVLAVDPKEVAGWVEVYTERFCSYPVRSREEIVDLFTSGGFVIDCFDTADLDGGAGCRPSGPTAVGRADYAQIIASRL